MVQMVQCDATKIMGVNMYYAMDFFGRKIPPTKNAKATCPGCGFKVIAKCGYINAWHWAHAQNLSCSFNKQETDWHLFWKSLFNSDFVEVKKGNHVYDVLLPNMDAFEFQNSSIKPEEIISRQNNGVTVNWIVNGMSFSDNFKIRKRGKVFDFYKRKYINTNYETFRWKWPRKTYKYMNMPILFDFGYNAFLLKRNYNEMRSGWGYECNWDQCLVKCRKYMNQRLVEGETFNDILRNRNQYFGEYILGTYQNEFMKQLNPF